jgi:hypothetical protein
MVEKLKKVKLLTLAGTLVGSLTLIGCIAHPLVGLIYTEWNAHAGFFPQEIGPKQSETCVSNILGLISTGNASVLEAARKAGIKKITSIDYKVSSILGLYGTYCIVVTGE